MIEATRYPLTWPAGWPRTPAARRAHATFRTSTTTTVSSAGVGGVAGPLITERRERRLSVADAVRRLSGQLALLAATDELLSTNVQTRLDGLPRAGLSEPTDPGAAVYFRLRGQDRCLACDRWLRVADNIAAIAQHIDAIRRIDRYGVGTLDQAFAGYAALPAKGQTWRASLGFRPDEDVTREQIQKAFQQRARRAHPDAPGGSDDQMSALVEARDDGLRECR